MLGQYDQNQPNSGGGLVPPGGLTPMGGKYDGFGRSAGFDAAYADAIGNLEPHHYNAIRSLPPLGSMYPGRLGPGEMPTTQLPPGQEQGIQRANAGLPPLTTQGMAYDSDPRTQYPDKPVPGEMQTMQLSPEQEQGIQRANAGKYGPGGPLGAVNGMSLGPSPGQIGGPSATAYGNGYPGPSAMPQDYTFGTGLQSPANMSLDQLHQEQANPIGGLHPIRFGSSMSPGAQALGIQPLTQNQRMANRNFATTPWQPTPGLPQQNSTGAWGSPLQKPFEQNAANTPTRNTPAQNAPMSQARGLAIDNANQRWHDMQAQKQFAFDQARHGLGAAVAHGLATPGVNMPQALIDMANQPGNSLMGQRSAHAGLNLPHNLQQMMGNNQVAGATNQNLNDMGRMQFAAILANNKKADGVTPAHTPEEIKSILDTVMPQHQTGTQGQGVTWSRPGATSNGLTPQSAATAVPPSTAQQKATEVTNGSIEGLYAAGDYGGAKEALVKAGVSPAQADAVVSARKQADDASRRNQTNQIPSDASGNLRHGQQVAPRKPTVTTPSGLPLNYGWSF